MQGYGHTIITDQGTKMLTAVDGAKGKIAYTKAVLYTQDIKGMSDDEQRALTVLEGEQFSVATNVTEITENMVTVSASFNNAKVLQDIRFNSIGWFAKITVDDQEKLLAVTPSETEQTLVAGSSGASTSALDINMRFARSHNATVVINPTQEGLVTNTDLKAEIERNKLKFRKEEVDVSKADINLNDITCNSEGVVPIANLGLSEVKKDFPKNHRLPLFAYDLGPIYRGSDVSLARYKVRYDDNSQTIYQEVSFYGVSFYRSFVIPNSDNNNYIWKFKANYEYQNIIILDKPINFKQFTGIYDEESIVDDPEFSNYLVPFGKFMLHDVADGINTISDYGEPVLRSKESAMLEITAFGNGTLLKYTLYNLRGARYFRVFYLIGNTWKEVSLT